MTEVCHESIRLARRETLEKGPRFTVIGILWKHVVVKAHLGVSAR